MAELFWKRDFSEGTFGDGQVLMYSVLPEPSAPMVFFLHGVHGSANLEGGNKYKVLGELFYRQGIGSCLVESSRARRDRSAFGEDYPRWALSAFQGKTYFDDLLDFALTLEKIQTLYPSSPLWLWGFSLGGIHGTILTSSNLERLLHGAFPRREIPRVDGNAIKGFIISGSGHSVVKEQRWLLEVPILDSLPPGETLLNCAKASLCTRIHAFYGSLDDTFEEESCRTLFEAFPEKARGSFTVLSGANHAFRTLWGEPSLYPLRTMTALAGGVIRG